MNHLPTLEETLQLAIKIDPGPGCRAEIVGASGEDMHLFCVGVKIMAAQLRRARARIDALEYELKNETQA